MGKKITASSKRRVTNAGPVMSPAAISTTSQGLQGSIRSEPVDAPWNVTSTLRSGQNRRRVQISRSLDEKLPIAGYLNRAIPQEALGDGMSVVSISANPDFKKRSTAYFHQWASSNKIDVRGEVNFYTAQPMLGHLMERDGEVFAAKIKSSNPADFKRSLTDRSFRALQLQFLRRDQIGSLTMGALVPSPAGRWDDGILVGDLDRAKMYRVLQQPVTSLTPSSYIDRDASLILHIKKPLLEGVHGKPAIFRGEDCALDLLDHRALSKYSDKIRAAFLGVVTSPTGEVPRGMREAVKKGEKPDPNDPTAKVDNGIRYYEIAGGVHLPVLKKDENITFFTGQSSLSFGEQITLLYKEIILARDIPPEYIQDLAKLGSGAVRMVLRKVVKPLDAIRRPFRDIYCQGCWEFVIGDAIQRGLLPNVDDWNVVETRTEPDPSIDAGRDERNELDKIRAFMGSRRRYWSRLGEDGDHIGRERLDEIAGDIAYGLSLSLPWFLCVDPFTLQSLAGLAKAEGPAIEDFRKALAEQGTTTAD